MEQAEFVVLGGGVAGLTAGASLGTRAVVLEKESRPGGLVRTANFDGFWFDYVLHVLHFSAPEVEARIKGLAGESLVPCPPRAMVQFEDAEVRFPFQLNLHGLATNEVARCVRDYADALLDTSELQSADYQTALLRAFGQAMCERFFFPYNRKSWRRPLADLVPDGIRWNLHRPSLESVIRGALGDQDELAYNANGWYPRPPSNAPVRGMEGLSASLARHVGDLRLEHCVRRIHAGDHQITVSFRGDRRDLSWHTRCMSSIPLPTTISLCIDAPANLKRECASLRWNRVRSVALSIEGPRPDDGVHWRYYPDESVAFTRLVYTCEFDPRLAPASGWGLLAEVTERGEDPPETASVLIDRVRHDLSRISGIPGHCHIRDAHVMDIDPAYVVFTPETASIVSAATNFLRTAGIDVVGRYGRWEYSSMAQVMSDALRWADALSASAEAMASA